MNETRGKNLLQIPAEAKGRPSSTSDIPEDSPKEIKPQIRQRPSSESDLTEANAQSMGKANNSAALRHGGRFQTLFNLNEHFSDCNSSWKLTEQAKHLSQEEMHSLEIDIFKPLDFYEILFNRMRITNNETTSEHTDGQ